MRTSLYALCFSAFAYVAACSSNGAGLASSAPLDAGAAEAVPPAASGDDDGGNAADGSEDAGLGALDAGPDAFDASDASDASDGADGADSNAPPSTWREHWFEHNQRLELIDYNDDVALYFDPDVSRSNTSYLLPLATRIWQYTRETYGPIGQGRLFWIFHQGRYSGGHPASSYDASHDFRNVSDCGPGPWTEGAGMEIPTHETGHIVEGANNGAHGSPAFDVWGDSKWAEFYIYDVYMALGRTADAERVYTSCMATTDDFPRAGTHWFRDWFYPLWRDHGHGQIMAKFFRLLSANFPKNGVEYSRSMNFGEFVHFMSGAAEVSLVDMATNAFGWPPEREAEYQQARLDFAAITY